MLGSVAFAEHLLAGTEDALTLTRGSAAEAAAFDVWLVRNHKTGDLAQAKQNRKTGDLAQAKHPLGGVLWEWQHVKMTVFLF